MTHHVAIIGGGITGLSAAWFLQEAAQEQSLDVSYTLLERSARWGGKILTDEVNGYANGPFIVEGGPDSFLAQKPWALQLARRLGLEDRFLPTNDDRRQVFVLNEGRPTSLPDGLHLLAPTKLVPFVRSPLISPLGKLRMALDLFIPPKGDDEDESLADFVTRRLGREALDKLAEPLLAGIYNADAERQSLLATFPRFRILEKEHGSLIKGLSAARAGSRSEETTNGQQPSSAFISFRNGMQELVHGLCSRLSGNCRLNTAVEGIRAHDWGYALSLSDGSRLRAEAIILAVPAYVAARLLEPLAPGVAEKLAAIRYVSTGTISLGYRRRDVEHPLDGFGLLIPRSEERPLNAFTWTSTKFDRRAPQGHVLLRIFFGGSRRPEMMDTTDETLMKIVRDELKDLLGIGAGPLFWRIYRWPKATPQYDVGHLDRVAAIEAALPRNVHVAGSPYRGLGIPDCVHQARQTVNACLANVV